MEYMVYVHSEKRKRFAIGLSYNLRSGIRMAARSATLRVGRVLTPTRILGVGFEGPKRVALHLQVS